MLASGRAQTLPGVTLPSVPSLPVFSVGVRQDGVYQTAPIVLDGVPLFRIAVPNSAGTDQMSVVTRQEFINAALEQLTALRGSEPSSGTIYDPKTLQITVQPAGDLSVIAAADAHHSALPILTVTTADAKFAKTPVSALAEQWQSKLQTALVAALEKRQPAELLRNFDQIVRVAGMLIALTLLVVLLRAFMGRRVAALELQIAADEAALERARTSSAPDEASSVERRRFMGLQIRSSGPEMTVAALHAFATIVGWALVLGWFVAIIWALALFPQTTAVALTIRRSAIRIGVIVVGSIVVVRIVEIFVVRLARTYGKRVHGDVDRRTRVLLRIPTVASAITGFASFLIAFVAVLLVLGQVGISTGSVLTLGGIVALGVTFAAQNLLRDVLNGCFVLFEDQYVVGDYVIIDQWSGIVENMTLRVAQLRDGSGNLITIPHGQVTQVVNCSRDWSRVDFRLPVDPKADVARALGVVREQIETLAKEERWRSAVLGPIELIGVEMVAATGIVLRASIKTAPLRQFELRRELNARVLQGLREAGIGLGIDPKVAPGAAMSVNLGPA